MCGNDWIYGFLGEGMRMEAREKLIAEGAGRVYAQVSQTILARNSNPVNS